MVADPFFTEAVPWLVWLAVGGLVGLLIYHQVRGGLRGKKPTIPPRPDQ